jgi:hypothetical protein
MQKMRKIPLPKDTNILHVIYSHLAKAFILFRDLVCKECNWSVPTFYRKLRLRSIISNAEKEKIIECFDIIIKETIKHTTGR